MKYPEEKAEFALAIEHMAELTISDAAENTGTRVVAGKVVHGTADPRNAKALQEEKAKKEENLSVLAEVAKEQEVREGLKNLNLRPAQVKTAADLAAELSANGGGGGGPLRGANPTANSATVSNVTKTSSFVSSLRSS